MSKVNVLTSFSSAFTSLLVLNTDDLCLATLHPQNEIKILNAVLTFLNKILKWQTVACMAFHKIIVIKYRSIKNKVPIC